MKSHYQHMNLSKARAIRILYFVFNLKQQAIADHFGIRQGSVSRILSNQVWYENP
jgi:DNA-binding transcriptional regulator LsrR (DeoR family)